ncbi:MAG: helix-turn-helix domain-containing protein [Hydrotalea sp.]|nr:helix-turn-helix domain-containing protein [Hydrotalea sp.]
MPVNKKKVVSAKSDIDQYVTNKVRIKRKEWGMSQVDLAIRLETSGGFIGQVESDRYKSHYSIAQINELAKIFKCSVKDFLPDKPL